MSCCRRNRSRPGDYPDPAVRKPLLKEVKDRITEEAKQKENAFLATEYYLKRAKLRQGIEYGTPEQLPEIGSRVQKYWFQASRRPGGSLQAQETTIITNAPITRYCSLLDDNQETGGRSLTTQTVNTLNELLKKLRQNPFIQPILDIGYLDDRKQVVIIQPLLPEGSLKDEIYFPERFRLCPNPESRADGESHIPDILLKDWAKKYPTYSSPVSQCDEEGYVYGTSNAQTTDGCSCCVCWLCTRCCWYLFCLFLCFRRQREEDHDSHYAGKVHPETADCCCVCYRRRNFEEHHVPNAAIESHEQQVIRSNIAPQASILGNIPEQQHGISKRPSGEYLLDQSAGIPASHQLSVGVSVDDIAIYGWQILKAMMFLYKQGFPVLGHVHSGNIFVQDGVCRLGGYENTLLGYRSRYYRMCQNHLEHMDVIMFGHVVFEMCCGNELTTVFPTAQDYQAVKRVEGGERVEEVLRYMFDLVTSNADGQDSQRLFSAEMIKMIKDHDFFRAGKENVQMNDKPENIGQRLVKGLRKPFPTTVGGEKVILNSSMKALLARVRQGVDSRAESEPVAKLYAQP